MLTSFLRKKLHSLDVDKATEFWRGQIASSVAAGTQLLVTESGNQVVGFSSFGPARDDDLKCQRVMELYALYVRPSFWGTGAGCTLMSATNQSWSQSGVVEATLWVLQRNERARAFYERFGWRIDERIQPTGANSAELEIRYRNQPDNA